MKKLLTLALALMLAFSVTACNSNSSNDNDKGSDDESKVEEKVDKEKEDEEKEEAKEEVKTETKEEEKEEKVSDNGEVAATKTADAFMDALCEFDIAKMSEYCNVDLVEEVGFENINDLLHTVLAEAFGEDEELEDDINKLINAMVDGIFDNTSYKIIDSSYNDSEWTFDVELTSIKLSDIMQVLEGDEMVAITEKVTEELVVEYEEKFGDREPTEEESTQIIYDMTSRIIDAMAELITETANDAEKITDSCVIIVINEDGKWLVDGENSNIDAFPNILNA